VREILRRYSSFVPFPINLNGEKVNTVQALWLRGKNEIKDEEYEEFYKFQANAFDAPRYRHHFSADAPLAINALLFVPQDNPERWGFGRVDPAVALYCRKILIDASPKDLLPEWLRFLKGVVDSEDLPLNISRETLQDRTLVEKLNRIVTGRFLKFLEDEARHRPDGYKEFFRTFGIFLKEGAAIDFTHREALARLLRFESSVTAKGDLTSLEEYSSRVKDGQKEVYYLAGPNRETIESSPYFEAFKLRGLEVLFLYDAVDEFVMGHLREFDGRKFVAGDSPDLKLDDVPPPPSEKALSEDDTKALCAWLKEVLGDRVTEVVGSDRLVDSPVMALNTDLLGGHMRRMMRAMDREAGRDVKVKLEVNPRHAVVVGLDGLRRNQPDFAKLVAEQVLDNALVAGRAWGARGPTLPQSPACDQKFAENESTCTRWRQGPWPLPDISGTMSSTRPSGARTEASWPGESRSLSGLSLMTRERPRRGTVKRSPSLRLTIMVPLGVQVRLTREMSRLATVSTAKRPEKSPRGRRKTAPPSSPMPSLVTK
jgi:TNF receptor-associated protein 1